MPHTDHRKELKGAAITIVSIALSMAALEYTGLLAGPEGWTEDLWLRMAGSRQPPISDAVVLITIDDATYGECFHGQSPMNPDMVFSLVDQVRQLPASVIGVDILTDSPQTATAYQALAAKAEPAEPKVVWAAAVDGNKYDAAVPNFFGWLFGEPTELVIKPSSVLGFDPGELDLKGILWGPAVYAPQEDEKLRIFPRELGVSADPKNSNLSVPQETWARVIGDIYCERDLSCRQFSPERREVFLPWGAGALMLKVHDFFSCPAASPRGFTITRQKLDYLKQRTAGKIVLIGGSFAGSGDFHPTSRGISPGIEINAHAVEAEISGSGLSEVKPYLNFLMDLITGAITLLALFALQRFWPGAHWFLPLAASLGAAVVLWLAILLFLGKYYIFSLATVVLGVLVHKLLELREHHKEEPTHKRRKRRPALHRG
jgi:CHASE2 domain-containing sensor protein